MSASSIVCQGNPRCRVDALTSTSLSFRKSARVSKQRLPTVPKAPLILIITAAAPMALAQSAAPPHCCPRSGGGGCCTHGRLCSSHRRRLQMLVLSHQPLGRRDASTRQHVACAARAPAAGGAGSGSASAATSAVGSAGLVALDLVSDVITGTAHVTSSGIRKALTAYQDATRFDPPEDKLPKRWAEQVDRGEGLTLMRHYDTVKQINALEAGMRSLDDAQLQAKTVEFKARLTDGAALDDLLPEAFAAVREASRRVLGLRHFDVQLVGGMALHEGRVAEMKTGEGKTLVATLPAYLRALTGRGVHVVTVNDYLARRDASWIGKVFTWLGVSVGAVSGDSPHSAQITAFAADITYVTGQELCFTYLRDNSSSTLGPEHLVLRRPLYFAIIDEVDSILIDECRNPLLISAPDPGVPKKRFPVAAKVAVQLRPGRGSDLNAVYAAAVALAQIPTQRRAHGLQQDMAIHGGWRDGGEAVCRAKAELLLPPNILKQLLDLKPYSVTNWEVAEELGYTWQVRGKGLVRESGDYSVDLRMRTVELTAYGAQRVAQLLRECLLRTRAASSS